jgi:hypothetical protein
LDDRIRITHLRDMHTRPAIRLPYSVRIAVSQTEVISLQVFTGIVRVWKQLGPARDVPLPVSNLRAINMDGFRELA